MLNVCKLIEQLLQSKLDDNSMKSLSFKLAVSSVTILFVWSNKYLVGKELDYNIINGNGITSVGEDVESYRILWKPCILFNCTR